jgi:hypothetical protein
MKKFSVLLLLIFLGGKMSFAQSLEDVKKLAFLNQLDKAKESVDKFLAEEKNAKSAEAWYYKGYIYNGLSKDVKFAPLCAADCKMESFNAYKKYLELDAKGTMLKEESYGSLFDLYNGYFDKGATAFNAKDYDGAYQAFANAIVVEDYISKKGFDYKGFKFSDLDTSLILNTAISARQAKKDADAVTYYTRLANANLNAPAYLEVYQFLVDYYDRKKDYVQMQVFLDKGKLLYPAESFWLEVELNALAKETDKEKMFAKYNELYTKYPSNYIIAYNYAVETYNALYTGDKKPANANQLKEKLHTVLKAAIQYDTTANSNILMARHLYADAANYDDEIKLTKDAKKKAELKAKLVQEMNECISYAEAAIKYFSQQPKLKMSQKTNYKSMLDYLVQIYLAKGDAKKSAEYDKKKLEVDKL